jgi:hypothetical protein
MGEIRIGYKIVIGKLEIRDNLGDLCIDWLTILKQMLEK